MDAIHSPAGASVCPTCSRPHADAPDELGRVNSLLLAAIEATADGLLVVDLEGRTIAHNSRFLEMWGIPADYIARGNDEELRAYVVDKLADPQGFAARVEALYADPEALSDDVIHLRDGRVFERFSHPQRLDGRVVGRVWSFRDATARVRAEEELRSRERQLAETQRLAALGSWRWDVRENRVTWSDELYRIYDLDRDTFAGTFEAYLGRVHPDDVADVKARLAAALENGGRVEFEERIVRPDGSVRVLRSMCEVTRDPAGRPERVVGACHDITEQRAAEDARLQSESRFRTMFEQFPLGIHILSPDGRTLEVNRAWNGFYDVDEQSLRDFNPFTDPALADVRDLIDRGFCGEAVVFPPLGFDGISLSLTPTDPDARWVQIHICPVRSADGSIGEVIAVHQDITESRRAADALAASEARLQVANEALEARVEARTTELARANDALREEIEERTRAQEERTIAFQTLQRSEEHFRSLIENGSDLIIVVDAEGRTSYLSPSAERILGWPPEQRLGRSSFEMLHPDDTPIAAARRQEAIDNPGKPVALEFRYRHKDGAWRMFEASVRTLLPDSADGGLVVNARDVTSRKAIEAELQRNQESVRTLIEHSGDMLQIIDATGRIMFTGPTVTRLLGWTPDEVRGTDAMSYVHPDSLEATQAAMGGMLANPGDVYVAEYRVLHKNGSYPYFEASARSMIAEDGSQVIVLNARDVTERRLAQDALAQAKEEAERAREAAEQANRAKSEFLSRMSHELRTPMNSILGFAQLLAKRSVDVDQSRSLDHILKAGRHLLNLINEVLDIARIEANRQHLSLEPVRLDGAIHEALTLIRPLAAQYECEIDDPASLPDNFVLADRQRLAQVLLNLLSNAVKYNRRGGRLWVTVSPEPQSSAAAPGGWRIAVHDTGPGIPAERMEELFVPFSRLGADLSEVEGTGLGLALSQRLVEAMRGTLNVESTVGVGSTFTVLLQSAADPLHHPGVAAASATPRAASLESRPATVLYIEDNLANLTLVETILAARPELTLISALQGRLGLDLAWQHRPDLVLLDLHLPDLPGDEVLARLRSDDSTRNTPVIVISADATPRRIQRLRDAGVFAYLTKPLDVDEFLNSIDAALDQRGA